jgi:small conductance mechanosensitive channel
MTQLTLIDWMQTNGWRLLIILLLWLVVSQLVNRFGRRAVQLILTKEQSVFSLRHAALSERDIHRIETLSTIFIQIIQISLLVMFGLMILSALGIPVTPLFAGAGIIGITLGFGSQSLIKDVSSGIFIVFENQFSRGDRVKLGEITGNVEELSLRTTVLRGDNDVLHFVPNGSISVVTNFSKLKRSTL